MKFFLLDAAENELDHAVAYYESCSDGLGIEFAEEVYRAVSLAMAFPEAGSPRSKNTRRLRVRRFPFGVIGGRDHVSRVCYRDPGFECGA
jgi:hypothetical protein